MFLSTNKIDAFLPPSRNEDPNDRRVGHLVKGFDYKNDEELSALSPGDVVLWGYPDDRGVERNFGRSGASEGPDEIRKCLYRMAVHQERRIWDFGNFSAWSFSLGEAHDQAAEFVEKVRKKGALPLSLGGGHDWAYPDFLGSPYPVLNVDAHLDMRPQPADEDRKHHSGTPFRRILEAKPNFDLCVLGLNRCCNSMEHMKWAEGRRVKQIFIDELMDGDEKSLQYIEQHFKLRDRKFALSLDLDVFSQSDAPGVSAPSVEGLETKTFFRFLRKFKKNISQMGIYELSPRFDRDLQTARLAAYSIYEYLF